jgi:AraC-like DNA-binding protein
MVYREHAIGLPGTVLWTRSVGPDPAPTRILPDGCVDLIWDGSGLFVAGPDPVARWHSSRPGTRYVGLRFSAGTGPAMLGEPALNLLSRSPRLDELWGSAAARELSQRVADDPGRELVRWVRSRLRDQPIDALGPRVQTMSAAGVGAAAMAERLGLSARQLHRRCLPLFGYGPRRLARILRLNRALDAARTGVRLTDAAADCGYADQAHLCREAVALTGATPTSLLAE